jgi:hypothetical protein
MPCERLLGWPGAVVARSTQDWRSKAGSASAALQMPILQQWLAASWTNAGMGRSGSRVTITCRRRSDRASCRQVVLLKRLDQLTAAGTLGEVKDRHAAHFADIARQLGAIFEGPAQRDAFDRVEAVFANFRSGFVGKARLTLRASTDEKARAILCRVSGEC